MSQRQYFEGLAEVGCRVYSMQYTAWRGSGSGREVSWRRSGSSLVRIQHGEDTDAALRRCQPCGDAASHVSNMASTQSAKSSENAGCRRSKLAKHSLRAYRMLTRIYPPARLPVRCAMSAVRKLVVSQTIRAVGAVMSIINPVSLPHRQPSAAVATNDGGVILIANEACVCVVSRRTMGCGYGHLSLPAYLLTWLPCLRPASYARSLSLSLLNSSPAVVSTCSQGTFLFLKHRGRVSTPSIELRLSSTSVRAQNLSPCPCTCIPYVGSRPKRATISAYHSASHSARAHALNLTR